MRGKRQTLQEWMRRARRVKPRLIKAVSLMLEIINAE
jgi:hypothetical protein